MKKINFVSIMSLWIFLIYALPSNALFGPNWSEQKTYCNKIKDVSEMINCDRLWERLQKEKKLPKDKDSYELCGKIFDYYKEIKPTPSWSLANSCLELISYRNGAKIPKDQMKMCDWLLESGKSVPRYLYCLQEFDPETIKVCEYPKDKGNYQLTGTCLSALQGISLSETKVSAKTLINKCLETNGGQDYLKRVTLSQWESCLRTITIDIPTSSVINFETGAFTGTGR